MNHLQYKFQISDKFDWNLKNLRWNIDHLYTIGKIENLFVLILGLDDSLESNESICVI